MSRLTRDETTETVSRDPKFSGANGDRRIFIFPVQLTTCRISNLARLIITLAICVVIHIYKALTIARKTKQDKYDKKKRKEKEKKRTTIIVTKL